MIDQCDYDLLAVMRHDLSSPMSQQKSTKGAGEDFENSTYGSSQALRAFNI